MGMAPLAKSGMLNPTGLAAAPKSCVCVAASYHARMMKLSSVQDQAIQALVAAVVGAEVFDRLFAGIRFDEIDGTMLYVFAEDEDTAAEVEDNYSLHIATLTTHVVKRPVDIVVVMPKVLQ